MPVSRKRKKKSQPARRSPQRATAPAPSRTHPSFAFGELLEHRRKLEQHRTVLAGTAAAAMIDALATSAPGQSDDDLEDDLCVRYGAAMVQYDGGPLDDLVNPDNLAEALLSVLDERLHEAEAGADATVLQRLLTVVAGVMPFPLSLSAHDLLVEHLGGQQAGRVEGRRAVTGPVLWARDVYGCRRAVVAPFASTDGPDRWYLWDVDTCGYVVVTVRSGFHSSAESALAAWRESAGQSAAGQADLTPVDDAETLGDLLRGEIEGIRTGGEDQQQYAEFLRSRRLGRTAQEAVPATAGHAPARLAAEDAEERFAQRLRRLGYAAGTIEDGERTGPVGADELAAELADSWSPRHHPALYPFCSPHKVALTVLYVRDYYQSDFAAVLVAALPEWIRFLAEETGMAAELTERCLAYASGDLEFPGTTDDDGRSTLMTPVAE